MAIKSSYEKSLKVNVLDQAPAPSFRATGQGLNVNNKGAVVANATKANACLEIPNIEMLKGQSHLQKIYLFVTRVATGWTISGTYGQAEKSRSWYPRNLAQNEFVIEGQMANQYQYDLLVEFIEHHQRTVVQSVEEQIASKLGNFTKSARFTMWPPHKYSVDAVPTNLFGPEKSKMMVGVVITSIKAGHSRFQFAPSFTLTCKVVEDHLHTDQDVTTDILDELDYQEIFGTLTTGPEPSTTEDYLTDPLQNFDPEERRVQISDGSTATIRRGTTTVGLPGDSASGGGGGGGGGGGTCNRDAVFPGYESGNYTSDSHYMDVNNPPPGGQGSNYGNGTAPVKYPAACQGGGDNRHDLSYTKSEGGAYVDSGGGRYDGKGRRI